MAYNDTETEHVELPATDARQGRWGQHALWMLLAGLVLVAIALFGTWLARSGDFAAINHKAESNMQPATSPSSLVVPKNKATDVRPTDRR
ncbi:MAG: hypothetical protein ACM3YN_12930 [Parcubacteria group bacterium]